MRKVIKYIGILFAFFIVVGVSGAVIRFLFPGIMDTPQNVELSTQPTTAPTISGTTEQKIREELKNENIEVKTVSFNKANGFANIQINADNELSSTDTVSDAWKAVYLPYRDIPEIKQFGVLVYYKDEKVLQIDGTREQVQSAVESYTTDTDKIGLKVGTMQYVRPSLKHLEVSGHPDLTSIINQ